MPDGLNGRPADQFRALLGIRPRPVLTLDQALDNAQKPNTRLCSLCGAAGELDPMLNGFEHIDDER
ncbi:hypothetical protein [Streptomyces sp. WM6378]|uniref:hypothetical protein n=1 Tax=Streptomyces sp. WM6378 TaxID=1415557 RepID=UPI0006AFDCC7|nr:hypothetical protein [Streptomyces sp. WM6378]KOU54023.1 hypothetical protein ADK54_02690 [Streptomyces sp. WM6378]